MSVFTSLFGKPNGQKPARAKLGRAPGRPRLRLEALEDRAVPAQYLWIFDGNGNWNTAGNWAYVPGSGPEDALKYPHNAGDSALLGNRITAARTVTIPDGVAIHIGDLQLSGNNGYAIAGTGRLHFETATAAGEATLSVTNNAAHTISAPVTLDDTLHVTAQSTGVLDFSGTVAQPVALPPNFTVPRGLIKDGVGTLRFSGSAANTYLGDTTVRDGTLQLNKTAGVNAFAGDLVVGDGTGIAGTAVVQHQQDRNVPDAATVTINGDGYWVLNGHGETLAGLTVNNGTVFVNGGGTATFTTLTMTGGTLNISAGSAATLTGAATINASDTGSSVTGAGRLSLGGVISLPRPVRTFIVADGNAAVDLNVATQVEQGTFVTAGLAKSGPGAMRLGAGGTFSGDFTLNAGTLLVGNDAALGTGNFVINGGAVHADGGGRVLNNPVTLGGDFTVAGSNSLIFNGPATLTGNRTVTVTNTGNTSFAGAIGEDTAGRGLIKAGPGTLFLSGAAANSYTGTTTVAHGTLALSKTGGANAFGGNLVVGDGTGPAGSAVAFQDQRDNVPDFAAVTVNANGAYQIFQAETIGPLAVNGGGVEFTGPLAVATLTMTGGHITTSATGDLLLKGGVTVNDSAVTSTIIGGHLQLGAATRTFAVAAAANLDVNSEIRGTAGFVKAGPGTMRLSGTGPDTYGGPTTVSAGTLELNKNGGVAVPTTLTINSGVVRELLDNEIGDGAAVNVNAGGTFALGGRSDAVAAVTVTGGTVATGGGTSAGLLAAGNTSFNAAATLTMHLAGATTSDRISANGTVALGGTLQLAATLPVGAGTAITLIDNDGSDAVAGTFAGLPEGSAVTAGGQAFTISYAGGTGNDVVLTRVVPATVTGTQINGGAAQRSMVTSLTVTFSTVVALPADAATAFTLQRIGGGAVTIGTATASNATGVTVVTLGGFAGDEASSGGSLNDGCYSLTALAAAITAKGVPLDGNGDGVGGDDFVFADVGLTGGLFRLFGDVNGDRAVNGLDLTAFRGAFGANQADANYVSFLDFDGNGAINGTDLAQFRSRFGTILP